MKWNIHYDVCAIIIELLLLRLFLYKKNSPSKVNRVYLGFLCTAIASTVLDIVTVSMISHVESVPHFLCYAALVLYFLMAHVAVFLYTVYICSIIERVSPVTQWKKRFVMILAAVDLILVLTNPLTKGIFYFDTSGQYCNGPLKFVVNGMIMLALLISLSAVIHHHDAFSVMQRNIVYFFMLTNIVAIVIQTVFPRLLITQFSMMLAVLLIYMTLQNAEDFVDSQTQLWNRTAFIDTLNDKITRKSPFEVIVVKLHEFRNINDMVGVRAGTKLLCQAADALKAIEQDCEIYRVSGIKFALIVPCEKRKAVLEEVRECFATPFEIGEVELKLQIITCVVGYPQNVLSQHEMENAIQYCIANAEKNGDFDTVYADPGTLKKMRRTLDLDKLLKRAIREKQFDVYYQPIRNAVTGEYHSAEALIRLYDDTYGFISPDEFIPRAEENGMILAIGELVFVEVCRMIHDNDIRQYGIEYIEINLSAAQCVQKNLWDMFETVMQKYQIPSEMINLELTETATVQSSEQLAEFMRQMNSKGIQFSLDDFGSGFATVHYLFSYPFHIVKLDKEIVWAAAKQQKASVTLRHTIEMIKDLKLHIIAEGVETQEQADMLAEMGCDQFQGYLYAKPMPEQQFVQFLAEAGCVG